MVLRARSFELKPEFEKAIARQEPVGASGGGSKKAPALFNRLASGLGLTKGDLQAAFERATAGKTVRKEDTDTAGHAPVDAEKLERGVHQLAVTDFGEGPDALVAGGVDRDGENFFFR